MKLSEKVRASKKLNAEDVIAILKDKKLITATEVTKQKAKK